MSEKSEASVVSTVLSPDECDTLLVGSGLGGSLVHMID